MKRLAALISVVIFSFPFFWSCSQKEQEVLVASITLSQPTAEMVVGESITLKATISPSNATEREIMWASSKMSVATVNQSGTVVAIAEGTSTITATAGGKMGSCVVTVSKGLRERELPVISGQSVETAVKSLGDQGFIATGNYVASDTVEEGKVIGYENYNAGDKAPYGSKITINISTGPENS